MYKSTLTAAIILINSTLVHAQELSVVNPNLYSKELSEQQQEFFKEQALKELKIIEDNIIKLTEKVDGQKELIKTASNTIKILEEKIYNAPKTCSPH